MKATNKEKYNKKFRKDRERKNFKGRSEDNSNKTSDFSIIRSRRFCFAFTQRVVYLEICKKNHVNSLYQIDKQ